MRVGGGGGASQLAALATPQAGPLSCVQAYHVLGSLATTKFGYSLLLCPFFGTPPPFLGWLHKEIKGKPKENPRRDLPP